MDNFITNKRLYTYEENLVRENSRKRKNRKQLCFTEEELEMIQENMQRLGIDNFSLYMRAVSCYGSITKETIQEMREQLM